ncbi:DUF2125 domain-containing protein [Roseobacter sp. YSTF-M11]|uniref:DUF2125 domain-containing protein n=1 Tax=Roseobacter insulae TaxID=2859783 RepID=A0A9X1JX35_9RHOB|nr:DUF2125 domain-containing protein [Roseobacter insulae]MBW4706576.1 DUF2125 domain-containing protein [Roseobacter insulae]
MSIFNLRCTTGALLLVSTSQAAYADITAQDTWNDWKSYFSGVGYTVTATETQAGDTLTVSDMIFTAPGSEEIGTMSMTLDQVSFRENGDGSVDVIFPEVSPIRIAAVDPDGGKVDISMEVRQSGMAATVSGEPTDMTSVYTARAVEMLLTEITVDDETLSTEDAAVRFVMEGLSGTSRTTLSDMRTYDQRMQANAVNYDVFFIDPEGGGSAEIDGKVDGISFAGTSVLPLAVVDAGDMSGLLTAGLKVDGAFTFSGGSSNTKAVENGVETFAARTSSSGGTLNMLMGSDGLSYSAIQKDIKVAMTAQDIPVPVEFGMAEGAFNITMPLQKSEEMNDFAFGFSLSDFSMSDLLWGMFDPTAQLPRDPATVILDLTGKARLLFDFLDPSAAVVSGDPNITPGEIGSVDINRLQITVAGAELTGDGAFTFDNSGPVGPPKPNGAVNLSLVGGNKLLDTLVGMGLLPEEQAMGARMMMGMLAVPGNAPDTMNSTIEINEQGHIMANGQRIQ